MNFFQEIFNVLYDTGLGESIFGSLPLHFACIFLTLLIVFMPLIFIYVLIGGFFRDY